jgi:hypothetical protein
MVVEGGQETLDLADDGAEIGITVVMNVCRIQIGLQLKM